MNKEELLEELTKLAKSNNDLGKSGDGYEKAINEAIQLVKNCSIPAVVGRSEQFYCTCSRVKGLDHDEEGMPYCIECQKPVQ